jgi:hypothetical protein
MRACKIIPQDRSITPIPVDCPREIWHNFANFRLCHSAGFNVKNVEERRERAFFQIRRVQSIIKKGGNMRGVKGLGLIAVVCLALGLLVSWSTSGMGAAEAPAKAVLTSDDCVKCHAKPVADIAAEGKGHKKITCQDCHAGHPPAVKNIIPSCNQCHTGKPHFELKGCLSCHTNPHTPKNIKMAGNVTDPCLTCHTKQIEQLREHKSKHTALYCSTCHPVHGKVPECLQCHKPHSSDMVQADCKRCHKAHMPKDVMYAADVPSKSCAACHRKAYDLLTSSAAKHKALECAFCHQTKHKMVPECQSCHGIPHPAGMMAKFTKCGNCHNIAHDLNRWSEAAKSETPKKEEKKEIKKKK